MSCPNGSICIDKVNAILMISLGLVVLYVANKEVYGTLYKRITSLEENKELQESKQLVESKEIQYLPDRDRVAINDQLYPPLKRNYHSENIQHEIPRNSIPINIETRPSGGEFQQVGILYKDNIDDETQQPGNNTDSNILPLYGKPLYRGSNNWLYYTATDKFHPIKIPITSGGKDCTDDNGCRELYEGDGITIPSYNGSFKVKIYKFDKPRYIPIV